MDKLISAALFVALFMFLAGCNELSDEQDAILDARQPVLIAEADGMRAYAWKVPDADGSGTETLYVVPNATATYERNCGKNCTALVTTAAPN
jgi:hypothetical protein